MKKSAMEEFAAYLIEYDAAKASLVLHIEQYGEGWRFEQLQHAAGLNDGHRMAVQRQLLEQRESDALGAFLQASRYVLSRWNRGHIIVDGQ